MWRRNTFHWVIRWSGPKGEVHDRIHASCACSGTLRVVAGIMAVTRSVVETMTTPHPYYHHEPYLRLNKERTLFRVESARQQHRSHGPGLVVQATGIRGQCMQIHDGKVSIAWTRLPLDPLPNRTEIIPQVQSSRRLDTTEYLDRHRVVDEVG